MQYGCGNREKGKIPLYLWVSDHLRDPLRQVLILVGSCGGPAQGPPPRPIRRARVDRARRVRGVLLLSLALLLVELVLMVGQACRSKSYGPPAQPECREEACEGTPR
jgi:hypothetical protein